jgi:hypothetical protein
MKTVFLSIVASVVFASAVDAEVPRFATVKVGKSDLNKAIKPYDLYVNIETTGDERERRIKVIVLYGEPVKSVESGLQDQLRRQVKPHLYKWHIGSKWWLAGFLQNRDGTFHTIVSMPLLDLNQSELSLLIEDVDGDGSREDLTIIIDLSGLDWSPSRNWVNQGASTP